MGYGETLMRTYGILPASTLLILGALGFTSSIMTILLVKSTVSANTKDSFFNYSIFLIIFSTACIIIACISLWKLERANKLYLKVGEHAAIGLKAVPATIITRPAVQTSVKAPVNTAPSAPPTSAKAPSATTTVPQPVKAPSSDNDIFN